MNIKFARGALIVGLIFIVVMVVAGLGMVLMKKYGAGSEIFSIDVFQILRVFGMVLCVLLVLAIFGIVVVPINNVGVLVLNGKIQNETPLLEGIHWVPFWAQVFLESISPRQVKIEPIEFEFEDPTSRVTKILIMVNVDPARAFEYVRLNVENRVQQIDAMVSSIVMRTLQDFIHDSDRPGIKGRTVQEFEAAIKDAKTKLSQALNAELYTCGVQARIVSLYPVMP